jgi:uncharacterized membrane protein
LSRLLSLFLEYINIVTGVLVIMSIAGLLTLVMSEPSQSHDLFFAVFIVLIIITVINGFIAALVSIRRYLLDIHTSKIRQVELLHMIAALNASREIEAQKLLDMKYPTTNL